MPAIDFVRNIYEHLGDEESKMIFENRFLYSLLLDETYIRKMLCGIPALKEFEKALSRPTLIYGAGTRGHRLTELFPNKEWIGYIDKAKSGEMDGLRIYSPDQLEKKEWRNSLIVVSNKEGYAEIVEKLVSTGWNREQIISLSPYLQRFCSNIYFDGTCLDGRNQCKGLFLDIGSYDGMDSVNAMNFFHDQQLEVFAFEPDKLNYEKCRESLAGFPKIKLFPLGISSTMGKRYFKENGGGSSVSEIGNIEIETTTIDNICNNQKVGFIKMDIEGLEEEALTGAVNTIKRDRPILALSVYHKRSDIWRLPMKVLEINPKYKLFFRHHTFSWSDTVLYAN